jgi:hypothetical protein
VFKGAKTAFKNNKSKQDFPNKMKPMLAGWFHFKWKKLHLKWRSTILTVLFYLYF